MHIYSIYMNKNHFGRAKYEYEKWINRNGHVANRCPLFFSYFFKSFKGWWVSSWVFVYSYLNNSMIKIIQQWELGLFYQGFEFDWNLGNIELENSLSPSSWLNLWFHELPVLLKPQTLLPVWCFTSCTKVLVIRDAQRTG